MADFHRLSLLLQRLLDADMLSEVESAPLISASESARRSLEEGNMEAARQHVQRLASLTETLVQTNLLDLADGQALIQVTDAILHLETDAGGAPR